MRLVEVSCALLLAEGKVLVARRGPSMSMAGKWEFPGGKIELGETPEQAIVRELKEELAIAISIQGTLRVYDFAYAEKIVRLYPFLATIAAGEIQLREHSEVRWLLPSELLHLDWSEADVGVVNDFLKS
jgi:8-oxo-dGTP diphosphatase